MKPIRILASLHDLIQRKWLASELKGSMRKRFRLFQYPVTILTKLEELTFTIATGKSSSRENPKLYVTKVRGNRSANVVTWYQKIYIFEHLQNIYIEIYIQNLYIYRSPKTLETLLIQNTSLTFFFALPELRLKRISKGFS